MIIAGILAISLSLQTRHVCVEGTLPEQLNALAASFGVGVAYDYDQMRRFPVADRYCPSEPVTLNAAYFVVLGPAGSYFEWINERTVVVISRQPMCQDISDPETTHSLPCLTNRT